MINIEIQKGLTEEEFKKHEKELFHLILEKLKKEYQNIGKNTECDYMMEGISVNGKVLFSGFELTRVLIKNISYSSSIDEFEEKVKRCRPEMRKALKYHLSRVGVFDIYGPHFRH